MQSRNAQQCWLLLCSSLYFGASYFGRWSNACGKQYQQPWAQYDQAPGTVLLGNVGADLLRPVWLDSDFGIGKVNAMACGILWL
jgi:hypothetical protein